MIPDQLWLRAEAAADRKEFAAAEALYREALSAQPTHAASLIGLSTMLTRRRAHRDAHAAALRAFDARPVQPPLVYAVAQRLRYFHEFRRLTECLAWPEFADGAPADVLARAAVMLSSIGAHQQASDLVERGLERTPDNAALLHVWGNFQVFRGDPDAAEPHYEASLRKDPLLFQNALMLANMRTQTPERNHVPRLRQQLSKARPGGPGEVYLAYALFKELHDLKDHAGAWAALQRACRTKRGQVNYKLDDDSRLVANLEGICTPAFLADTSAIEQPAVPIFIVGMHRSGTTLLERMLAGHRDVGDAGETSAFHAQMELATDIASPAGPNADFVRAAAGIGFDDVARGYAESARWLSRGRPWFTEKLPQNFFNVGFIAKALPQARFLHLVRDPVDTCFSNLRTLFSGAALYSYDQAELAGFYLLYRRMMAHWHAVLPGRVLDVSYDALVEQPEAMARRVAAHCGLAFEPAMVDIERSTGVVSTPSANVARQGFRRDRGRAWTPYARELQPLVDALADGGCQSA